MNQYNDLRWTGTGRREPPARRRSGFPLVESATRDDLDPVQLPHLLGRTVITTPRDPGIARIGESAARRRQVVAWLESQRPDRHRLRPFRYSWVVWSSATQFKLLHFSLRRGAYT